MLMDARMHQLAAQLERMSPQQRQKFAMQHKDDPIAVSMAKYVNDQAKALSDVQTLKSAPQTFAAPPVIDQAINDMAPPKVDPTTATGIGALPTADAQTGTIQPQSFKKGGAVRFDDGGYVDPYGTPSAVEGEPTGIGAFLKRPLGVPLGLPTQPQMAAALKAPLYGAPASQATFRPNSPPNMGPDASLAGIGAPAAPDAPEPPARPTPAMNAAQQMLAGGPGGGGGSGGAPGGIGVPKAPAGLDFQKILSDSHDSISDRLDSFQNEMDKVQQDRVAAAEANAKHVREDNDALGLMGTQREAKLNERAQRLTKAEDENKNLALLSAGLAMMAGTSPNAFANIGNGAQVGLQQYQQGREKLLAMRDHLDDAYWQLESMRYGDKRASMKEIREADNEAKKMQADARAEAIKTAMDVWKVDQKQAETMLNAAVANRHAELSYAGQVQGAEISGRYNLAGHQAQAGAAMAGHRMALAGSLAATEGRNGELAQLYKMQRLGMQGEHNADQAIAAQNRMRVQSMKPPLSPAEEQQIRDRYSQYTGGIGAPAQVQDNTPALDPSQWTVRPKN